VMSDEVIAPFTVNATWDELPEALLARYTGVADRILPYLKPGSWSASPEHAQRWATVVQAVTSAAP
jgi:hypothetical protein